MIMSKKFRLSAKSKLRASIITPKPYPAFALRIVRGVMESWEEPFAENYTDAFEDYLEELNAPEAELQRVRRERLTRTITKIDRMKAIAPDLFEKALSHAGLNQSHFIDWREHSPVENQDEPSHNV